ncbi:MAG: phage terminase large subunit [Clostridia bacterium]|nr:phage terminase large subunit [Clostridia bacterium]
MTEQYDTQKTVRIAGVPNPKQAEFFASRAGFTAYGGARGGGKSWALRRKLIAMCLRYAGIRCLLVRRTFAELKANHLSQMMAEYGAFLTYSEAEKCFSLANGSRIFFGYCASDRDLLRYQGQEFDVIALDEATQLTERQFSALCASLRGAGGHPKRVYLTCNPGGVGHSWVKRLFIDREYRAGEDPDNYRFIRALVTDNRVLMEKDPDYVTRLGSLPAKLRDAWLYGRWDIFEGQFFPEFDEDKHLCDEEEIPFGARYFVAMDYGFDMLAALLLAVGDGEVFVVRELCVPNLTLGEAAARVTEAFRGFHPEYAVASPDLWNRRQDTGRSGFEIMQGVAGMPPMIPADDRRVPGWRAVREYLTPPPGAPRLRICRGCSELIHSMSALLFDKTKAEDAAGEPHAITHAPEALRYALMSRITPPKKEKEEDFFFPKPKKKGLWE